MEVVNQMPKLRVGQKKGGTELSGWRVKKERNRRDFERRMYQELSRYYWLETGQWTTPKLLRRREHGLF